MFCLRNVPKLVLSLLLVCSPAFAQSSANRTTLVVNNNTSAAIDVFVVLAALGGGCSSDNPPITAAQLKAAGFCEQVIDSGNPPYAGKCQFTLGPNQAKTFPNIPNTCVSGNVTFGGYPACPDAQFPTGYTTAEFTLNTSSGLEDVDVSLVNGYNYPVMISMTGGGGWVVSGTSQPITQIVAKPLGQNIGNPGVFPENCTDCIRLVNQPVCPGFSTNPTCQPARICDAQRPVSNNGGTVMVSLQPPAPGPDPCASQLLALQSEIAADNAAYNRLTGKNSGPAKQRLKNEIIAATNQLNTTFAACGTCGGIATLQAQITSMFQQYGKLTGNNQDPQRVALKAQIIAAQAQLQAAISGCPPCQEVVYLRSLIQAQQKEYNAMTSKAQAAARQSLKAQIIANQNQLTTVSPACIVPIP